MHRSGFGDLQLRFTTSLLAGSALTPAEFARDAPDRTLGASLVVIAPTGQYMKDRLINIGTNRWEFKPEIGGSRQFGRWNVESSIAAWFFTSNSNFVDGPKQQDPIGAIQGHVSYTFKPRLWLAADATFYAGGRTTLNGTRKADVQSNSRLGVTLALPLGRRSNLKVSWATGFTTRVGADFDTISVGLQTVWFGKP